MVNDKAPQSSNASHIRFMRLTLLLYLTSNLFAHGVFLDSRKLLQIPIEPDNCSDAMPGGSPAGRLTSGRAKAAVCNVTHQQRTAESLCRPITRRGAGEPTCAHAGSAMASGSSAAS